MKTSTAQRLLIDESLQTQAGLGLTILAGLSIIVFGVAILASTRADDLFLSTVSLLTKTPPAADWPRNLKASAVEALVVGALYLALVTVVFPRRAYVLSLLQRLRYAVLTGVTALVLLWLPVVLIGRSVEIAGERYWYLGDDAMISMRYARNLASGIGLVWNPGERIEGYTNFLWTIFMAIVHLLPLPDSKTSLVVLLTNIAIAAATIPVIVKLVRMLDGRSLVVIAAVMSFVLSKGVMYWASYGFETAFLGFLFLLAVYRTARESRLNRPSLLTYLLIGAIALVRADGIVISVLLYLLSFGLAKDRKAVLRYAIVSLLLPVAGEAFRIYYYGDVIPNTAYLKTANWDGRYLAGLKYISDFALHYSLPIAFAAVGLLVSRQKERRWLLFTFLIYVAYVAYVGGDAFSNYRFFVPFIPLLMTLAFLGIQDLENVRLQRYRAALGVICFVAVPLITPGYATALFPYSGDVGNLRIGLLLKENTPRTSRIADFWAGSVFYFSERYAIDFLGKSDRYIAHLEAQPTGTVPGHNKFDFNYSIGLLKPDYVVSFFKLPVTDAEMKDASSGDWAFNGQLYFNATFRQRCLSNPIRIDTWRTIFACEWPHVARNKHLWKDLGQN